MPEYEQSNVVDSDFERRPEDLLLGPFSCLEQSFFKPRVKDPSPHVVVLVSQSSCLDTRNFGIAAFVALSYLMKEERMTLEQLWQQLFNTDLNLMDCAEGGPECESCRSVLKHRVDPGPVYGYMLEKFGKTCE